jgi:hypothetical protein
MVEVFKTNVRRKTECRMLQSVLVETFPSMKINFDLEDCDKVLRVEGREVEALQIIGIVKEKGFECEVLD